MFLESRNESFFPENNYAEPQKEFLEGFGIVSQLIALGITMVSLSRDS